MTHMLNLTLKLKQDPQTQQIVKELKDGLFAEKFQPVVDEALRKSELVHYARVVIIDNLYIQVLTEFDGEKREYTDFFLEQLSNVFEPIFSLAEDAPPWDELKESDKFFEYAKDKDLPSLGASTDPTEGYAFKAYGDRTVKEINKALKLLDG